MRPYPCRCEWCQQQRECEEHQRRKDVIAGLAMMLGLFLSGVALGYLCNL
jgi:hypothetical protein